MPHTSQVHSFIKKKTNGHCACHSQTQMCVSVCMCVIECESTGIALFVVNVDKAFRDTQHVYVWHIQMHRYSSWPGLYVRKNARPTTIVALKNQWENYSRKLHVTFTTYLLIAATRKIKKCISKAMLLMLLLLPMLLIYCSHYYCSNNLPVRWRTMTPSAGCDYEL